MPIYTKVDSYTKLLIHSLSTNNNANFYDYSPSQHTVTTSSDPVHSTTQKKLGDTSIHFDGNDTLLIADHADLDLDGGNFTIDLWFRCDDVDSPALQSVLAKWQVDTNNSYYCLIHPTASLRWYVGNGGSGYAYVGGSTIADDTWYHAALTKVGDVFTAYINGVQDGGTTTYAAFADNNLPVTIGSDYQSQRPFTGYIDEVRISKGIARWTSNFIPPTRPYGVVDSELNASLSRLNTILTATNSGRIGIGTASPEDTLEVEGEIKVKASADHTHAVAIKIGRQDQAAGNYEHHIESSTGGGAAQNKMTFALCNTSATGHNDVLVLDGYANKATVAGTVVAGALSAGATSLSSTLGVTGASTLSTVLIQGLSNYTGLEVKGAGAARPQVKFTNVNQGLLGAIYGTEGNALAITTGTGGARAITIDSSQNVGIGAIDPTRPLMLTVAHTNSAVKNAFRITTTGSYSSGNSMNSGVRIELAQYQNLYDWPVASIDGIRTDDNWGGSIVFNTNNNSASTNQTERMRINHDGKVGIGLTGQATNSYVQTLEVNGGIQVGNGRGDNSEHHGNYLGTPYDAGGTSPIVGMYINGHSAGNHIRFGGGTDYTSAATTHSFYSAPLTTGSYEGTRRLYIASDGKIGVNTSTFAADNSSMFSVVGRVSIIENAATSLQISTGSGYAWMEAWDNSSDRSPKHNLCFQPWGGRIGINNTVPATSLANTSTRIGNADGLTVHLSGINWEVNGQGYTAALSNLSTSGGSHNGGLLVELASTDATDKILDLESAGVNRVRVLGDGSVLIRGQVSVGATDTYLAHAWPAYPVCQFQAISVTANRYAATFRHDGAANTDKGISIICGPNNASGTTSAINILDGDGSSQGEVTFSGGTITYGTFTANHDAELPDADNDSGYTYGTLVETTEIFYKQKDGADTERGILYKVQKSSSANSKAVLGVYSNKYTGEDNLHQIYVLGDGHILCKNQGGDIAVGDGICTSSVSGIGMKATTNPSMIIGIAQEAVTFSSGFERKLVAVQYGLQQFTPWT